MNNHKSEYGVIQTIRFMIRQAVKEAPAVLVWLVVDAILALILPVSYTHLYTIQWMFGVPEVMDFLREHHVEEGDNIQIIRKLKDALIVGVKGSRFAMGNEIADRIQV